MSIDEVRRAIACEARYVIRNPDTHNITAWTGFFRGLLYAADGPWDDITDDQCHRLHRLLLARSARHA